MIAGTQPDLVNQKFIASFLETGQTGEPLGEEEILIDNSQSPNHLSQPFTVSRAWLPAYNLDYKNARTDQKWVGIELSRSAYLQALAEDSVKKHYVINTGIEQRYCEEIMVDVPANTKSRVMIFWRRLWQQGILTLSFDAKRKLNIPFQVAIGAMFDQIQVNDP